MSAVPDFPAANDPDSLETQEWLDALEAVLEREGFLTAAEGSGVFVTGPPLESPLPRLEELRELCEDFLARASQRGFTAADVLRYLQVLTHGDSHDNHDEQPYRS